MHWDVVPASLPYLLQGFRATLILPATVLVTLYGPPAVVPHLTVYEVAAWCVASTTPDVHENCVTA